MDWPLLAFLPDYSGCRLVCPDCHHWRIESIGPGDPQCFRIRWYEVCFMAGGIIGNLLSVYQWHIPVGLSMEMGVFGIFMGIYVGCFIGALAEVVNVFPILFHRLRLREGMKAFIWAIALGKAVGGIIDFFL
ncbi:MAG: stage V sporulation protein AB [Frisingicoccus sp.]